MTAWTLFWLLCAGVVLVVGMYLFYREDRASHRERANEPADNQGTEIASEDQGYSSKLRPDGDQHAMGEPTPTSQPTVTRSDLRELMGIALTTPTPEAILEFSAFASRLRGVGKSGTRRLGPYNIMMVFTQRPGAWAVASRSDWEKAGQTVMPDAIPILILRPNGPTMQVFELEDTLPRREKVPDQDAFAAVGDFKPEKLHEVIERLSAPNKRNLKVEVDFGDLGSNSAGWICEQPTMLPSSNQPFQGEPDLGALHAGQQTGHWRIMLNRRLTPAEQFATLLHELGHLFCGHAGPFDEGNASADEYGWPDRSSVPYEAMEIEAELVSWHICERKGLVTGSALYLRPHMEKATREMQAVDLDRVTRAIAKIEHYVR